MSGIDKIDGTVYSEIWQEAVLGHMLTNEFFFEKCRIYIEESWFRNPRLGFICKELYRFYDKYNIIPRENEFITKCIMPIPDGAERRAFQDIIGRCKISKDGIRLEVISQEMTGWIKVSRFRDSLQEASAKYNKGDYSDAIEWVDAKIQDLKMASFMDDNTFDFSKPDEFYESEDGVTADGISTGEPNLDKLLVGERTYKDEKGVIHQYPGLQRKNMTVVLGAINSGKTSVMVTLARHAIAQDKRVLIITHEGSERNIVDKIYKAYTESDINEISDKLRDSVKRSEFITMGKKLNENLVYKHIETSDGMFVEDVVATIKHLNAKMISRTGKGFDLVIDDYPGLLMTRNPLLQREKKHVWLTHVYKKLQSLAKELNFHLLAPMQVNRSSFQMAKKGEEFLDMDSIAEAFGVAACADSVITINRSDKDKKTNMLYLYIAKNRLGETGNYFSSSTDLSRSIMFGHGMGGKITKGSVKMEDLITSVANPSVPTSGEIGKESEPNE